MISLPMAPSIILINPWIYDFAAYDLWSKPLGLLYLAGFLRSCGFHIHAIDCMNVHHAGMVKDSSLTRPVRRKYGTGKYWKEQVSKPTSLKHIQRSYSRYGISKQLFLKELRSIENPTVILVTSLMTYWYPGAKEAIALAKEVHPNTPVILGGIYALLCKDHAVAFSGADSVISESGVDVLSALPGILADFGIRTPRDIPDAPDLIYPAFDLYERNEYICLLTSTGCPYRCHYCAGHFLAPQFFRRDPSHVLDEILHWHKDYGVHDFAFYDDALLVGFETHLGIVLEELSKLNIDIRFHTPNALHVREINRDVAQKLYRSGFRTIRLGFETADPAMHLALDKKVSDGDFELSVGYLREAGFSKRDIGAYILIGLPDQSVESIEDTIHIVHRAGAYPYLAEYSPIPHTQLWEEAVKNSEYDIVNEPLFHNNTLIPCWEQDRRSRLPELKQLVSEIRQGEA